MPTRFAKAPLAEETLPSAGQGTAIHQNHIKSESPHRNRRDARLAQIHDTEPLQAFNYALQHLLGLYPRSPGALAPRSVCSD